MFKGAYFGKPYLCRNNTIAYYCLYSEKEGKHCLMTNDHENDFILCSDDGHVYDVEEYDKCTFKGKNEGKTVYEVYGWNREEMKEFRLDIMSEWNG